MYGYEEYLDITPEHLLQKIDQEDIFEFVLQEPFSFSTRYKSPFRQHSKDIGTCRFEQREDGTILFVDFGEAPGKTHRSCFKMVMDKEGTNLTGAMRIICKKFNLSTSKKDYKEVVIKTTYQYKDTRPTNTIITYTPKEYTKADTIHWSQFIIRPQHLLEDNVFSARRYIINSPKGIKIFTPYRYCYVIDFLDAVKIYQPYNKEYKFITNCNEDHIGNIDNIPATGDELIIQKAYKDHRVLRNLEMGLNVVWLHNEGCIPSIEILTNLVGRFRLLTLFFDADEVGVRAALRLYEILHAIRPGCARVVHLPIFTKRKSYKDPGEFVSKEGRKDTIEVIKQIGIYGKE